MKGGRPIYAYLIAILILIIFLSSNEKTLEIITGSVSVTSQNVSVSVVGVAPGLTLLSPANATYLTNISLLLNYSSTGANSVWYNLDNGANTTITAHIYFNTTDGMHTLYIFADNAAGTTAENITFISNSTKFIIYYDEWKGARKGGSTDFNRYNFNRYTFEELQNISGIILENSGHGKIAFNSAVNLTADYNPADNILDLDSYVNISHNRIELDSGALPNFNKPSTLRLYNLTFSNPRIMRDGAVCSDALCTKESYSSAGTLVFNVTSFTVYSAEETPSAPPVTPPAGGPGGGGGGGGGGGFGASKEEFTVSPEIIEVSLLRGQEQTITLQIKNIANKNLSITADMEDIEEFGFLSERSFALGVNKTKFLQLNIYASEYNKPIVYTGKIIFRGGSSEKVVNVIISVREKGALFDIRVEILPDYREVAPGKSVGSVLRLVNVGAPETSTDIRVKLIMADLNKKIIRESAEETIGVKGETSVIRWITTPAGTQAGEYLLIASATYTNLTVESYDTFKVIAGEEKQLGFVPELQHYLLFSVAVAVIILFYARKKYLESKKENIHRFFGGNE